MDPFAVVLFGGLAVFVLVVWLLGRYYPGSGLEELGLKSARQIIETRESLEAQDLDQLVAARNAQRRARGQVEVSSDEIELQVARELGAQDRRRERYVAERAAAGASPTGAQPPARTDDDRDLEQLLALSNERRRARGLPERSREELEGQGPSAANPAPAPAERPAPETRPEPPAPETRAELPAPPES